MRFRGGGASGSTARSTSSAASSTSSRPVERLEYDPNRTAFIALVKYADGEIAYILAPQRLKVGDQVIASEKVDVKPGNAAPLGGLPIGTIIHNVELKPLEGRPDRPLGRTYAQLVAATAATPTSVSTRANSAWCPMAAWHASARCRTRTT